MKTSSIWDLRSIVGKIMMGLVLTVMVGSVDVVPALGEDDHDRRGGRYEQRGRGHDRDRDRDRYRYEHGRRVYRTYDYRDRYYAPPPVVYAPPPAPGISIFLPIHR